MEYYWRWKRKIFFTVGEGEESENLGKSFFTVEEREENLFLLRSRIGIIFQNPDYQFIGCDVKHDIAFGLENQNLSR
ncbi:hypothetical protein OC713_02655, partial [Sweet potato little leaf phytoplasma]|nr:hypothetical protein [Sweet potato little leaf phytoplasma]